MTRAKQNGARVFNPQQRAMAGRAHFDISPPSVRTLLRVKNQRSAGQTSRMPAAKRATENRLQTH